MKNVSFVIPQEMQLQIRGTINYYLESRDPDAGKYLSSLAKIMQSIDNYYVLEDIPQNQYNLKFAPVNRSPFGRVTHSDSERKTKSIEEGCLSRNLSDCKVRNIDNSHRFVFFEISPGLVGVINVLGHYEKNLFNLSDLEMIKDNLKGLYENKTTSFKLLQQESDKTLSFLFSLVKNIKEIENIENIRVSKFNELVEKTFFPLSLPTIVREFERSKDSIIDNINNGKDNSYKTISAEQDNLTILLSGEKSKKSIIYKTLKNVYNISLHISSLEKNELESLRKVSLFNQRAVDIYAKLYRKSNEHINVFKNHSDEVYKQLQESKYALMDAFDSKLNKGIMGTYISTFKDHVLSDINSAIKVCHPIKREDNSDLIFKNSVILFEELSEQLSSTKTANKIQSWLNAKSITCTYYQVPFDERKDAKNLGMEWDRNLHCWYSSKNSDLITKKGWSKVSKITLENEKQERDKLRKELKVEKDNQNQKITQSNSIDSAKKKGRSR